MKSSSIFGRVLFLWVLILSPYFAFSAPVIQWPVVPAMYWRSLTGVSIFYTGGFVGIWMNNPLYRLDVAGTWSFDGLHMVTWASSGFVLTSDASGNARWISTGSLIPAESDPQVWTVTTNYVPKWTGTSLNNGTIFDTSTWVGIWTIAPSARLAVNGSIVYTESLSRTQANTVQYNNVVQWAISTPNQTWALKISLPRTWSNTMLSIKITWYEYSSTAGVWSTTVWGYNYAAWPSWINSSAYVLGKTPFSQIRLAHDGVTNTILLGNTWTIWNYSKIVVEEVFAWHSNMTGWGTWWTISLITDEKGISSVLNLVAPTYVSAAWNFGVGTMLPAYRLDVVGTGNVTWFRMPTGASSGFLLTSDPTWNARWLAAPNSGWWLNGNAGTSSGTNFVGTTDVQDLVFKVNSTEYLRIRAGGSLVWVGYSSTMSGSNQIALWLDAWFAMSGSFNSAIGWLEAWYFMRGIRNIAFWWYRAGNLMSGSYNSAFGWIQAWYQMGGAYSTAIGWYQAWNAMAGSHNTVIGWATVWYSMSGTYNAAIGWGSAWTFMQGSQNTAIGWVSAWANMAGGSNTAIGWIQAWTQMNGSYTIESKILELYANDYPIIPNGKLLIFWEIPTGSKDSSTFWFVDVRELSWKVFIPN